MVCSPQQARRWSRVEFKLEIEKIDRKSDRTGAQAPLSRHVPHLYIQALQYLHCNLDLGNVPGQASRHGRHLQTYLLSTK